MFENKLKKNKGKLLHIEIIPSFFFGILGNSKAYIATHRQASNRCSGGRENSPAGYSQLGVDCIKGCARNYRCVTSDTTVSSATTAINSLIVYRQYPVQVDGLALHGVLVAVTMLWRINPDVIGCIIRKEMKNNNNRKIFFFFPLMMTMSKHKDSL